MKRKSSNFRLKTLKGLVMKRTHFLFVLIAIGLTSCSTSKNSQGSENGNYYGGTSASNNGEYYSTPNDQYVHMLASNPARWSYFDDYNNDYNGGFGPSCFSSFGNFMYGYTPWSMGFGYWSPYSYWNSYYTWNTFYNPYYVGVVIVNPKSAATSPTPYTHVATFAPYSYSNNISNLYRSGYSNHLPVTKGASLPYSYSQTIQSNYSGRFSNPGLRGYSPSTLGNSGGMHTAGGLGGMNSSGGFSSHSMGGVGGGGHR
jgi:hypothetical protein